MHDVFGNSITIARFDEPASGLRVDSKFHTDHFPLAEAKLEIEA